MSDHNFVKHFMERPPQEVFDGVRPWSREPEYEMLYDWHAGSGI